ncbi:MAG: DUF1499 domain-containing protein [Spartobacteria bacterium]
MPENKLALCPATPNCVSSDSPEKSHAVAPLLLTSLGLNCWDRIRETILSLPRTKIVLDHEDHLQAECRSAWAGFVDDLELEFRRAEGIVAVRSASRTGYHDLGVNRRRVEKLRALLQKNGLVES